VVLRGSGDLFSVGLDLRWYRLLYQRTMRRGDDEASARRALFTQTHEVQSAISAVARCGAPVIAAISGECTGAALELALACDIRIASPESTFTAREVDVDIVADLGLLQRLPRLIGAGWARHLALTGATLDCETAARLGLVTGVQPDSAALTQAAGRLAAAVAGHPRHVLHGIKTVLDASQDLTLDQGLQLSSLWTAAFLPTDRFPDLLREVMATASSPATAVPMASTGAADGTGTNGHHVSGIQMGKDRR